MKMCVNQTKCKHIKVYLQRVINEGSHFLEKDIALNINKFGKQLFANNYNIHPTIKHCFSQIEASF